MFQSGSWARTLGNGAGIAAFGLVMAASLVHAGFRDWTASMDAAIFGSTHARYHPTLALCAAAVALVAGAIGYVAGRALDRRHQA